MPQSVDRILGDANFQAMDIEERRKVLLSVDAERFGGLDRGEQDKVLNYKAPGQPSAPTVTSQQRQLMSGLTGGADATMSARPEAMGGLVPLMEQIFAGPGRVWDAATNAVNGVRPDPVLSAVDKRDPWMKTPAVQGTALTDRIPGNLGDNLPTNLPANPEGYDVRGVLQTLKPVATGVMKTAESFTTPENAIILAISGAAGRLPAVGQALSAAAGAGFDAMMVSQAIQSAPELKQRLEAGDIAGAIEAGTELLAAGAMGAHGAKGKIDALRRQPGMTARPLEQQNARLAVEDAAKLTPQQLEQRNRELLQQGSPAVADVQQVAHEEKLQDGAYSDQGRKAVRRKADELRQEIPRSAEILDELARQKQQPAGREGRPSNAEELSAEEIRRAGREPVQVPEDGPSMEEQRMAARMEDLAEGYGKKFEDLSPEEQRDVHNLALQGFQNPETTQAKVRERASEQESAQARRSIAERLGLDLAAASPEDLAAVDQLAKESWTGQKAEEPKQPLRAEASPQSARIESPTVDTKDGREPLRNAQDPESVAGRALKPDDSIAEPSPQPTEEWTPQDAQSVKQIARELGFDPENLKRSDMATLTKLSRESIARALGVDPAKLKTKDRRAVAEISRDLESQPEAIATDKTKIAAEAELGASDQMIMGMEPPTSKESFQEAFKPQGEQGPINTEFRGKFHKALDWLVKNQSGEAIGALNHPKIGDIDLVWGDDSKGVAKFVHKNRLDLLMELPEFFGKMEIDSARSGDNRIILQDAKRKAVVRLDFDGTSKKWLFTAYEKGENASSLGGTTDITKASRGKTDTAPLPKDAFNERIAELKQKIKEQLGDERGSLSQRKAQQASLAQNLTELAGIYIRDGVQKFSEFMAKAREAFGKIPSGMAKAWNTAKKLNQDLGRGNPERGSIRMGKQVDKENPYLFDLDPKKLKFTESGQRTTKYEGDASRAITTYQDKYGIFHVLDGHHRTIKARSENQPTIRAVVIPEAKYLEYKAKGIHQGMMFREFAREVGPELRRKQEGILGNQRGSVRIEKGTPEEEAKIRETASGSGGRGGGTTETAAAAGAEADPRGTGGEPVSNPDKLSGEPRPTVSPSYEKTKPNILKNVAPEVAGAMEERLADFETRNPERKVVTFEDIREEARSLDPGIVARLDASKMKAGETLDPAVRFAARETLNGLNQEITTRRQEMVRNAGTWDQNKRLDEMRKVEAIEEDAKRLIDVLIPTRSQDGRNLAYHAMVAKSSFDVTFWLSRSRRALALPERVELPPDIEKGIREVTGKGSAAEADAVDRIQGDPAKGESAARRKAEKEAKAELGPEPIGGPEARSRAERAKAAAKPDPTLAEKQARYREKLLAKIEEKMKGVEKKPRAKSKWELSAAERAEVDNDPAVKQARIDLARKMMNLDRSTFLETLTTLRRAGLLTSVRTHIRNLGGNSAFQAMEEISRLPAMAVDAALATFTGERTVEGPSVRSLAKASRAAATRGVKEAGEIMRKGATDDQLAQMDMVKELNSGNRYLDAYANTIFRSMSAADRIFKTFAYERSIQEQLKLAKATEPTEGMRLRAWEDANFATFNNDNMAADLLKRGKSALAKYDEAGQLANFAIDLAVPFARTPANIVARVLDYTPVGSGARTAMAVHKAMKGGKGLTPEFQRQISMAIGRGAVGSALLTLGWNLSQAGLMTGIAPESRGERDIDEAAGRMYGSFLLDGLWHRVDMFSPLGNLLTLGATLQREQAEGVGSVLFAGAKTAMEQPMLSGASQVIDMIKDPARSANRFIGSVAGSFVPSAVADVASAFDDKRRDPKGDDLGSSVAGAVSNRGPGLRNTLPERRDVLGREQRQEWLSIVDPTIGSEAKELSNPVLKEMVENRVVMQKPNKPKDMPVEAYQARQKLIGDVVEARLGKLIASPEYTGDTTLARRKLAAKAKVKPDDGVKAVRREMIEAEITKVRSTFTKAAKGDGWDALTDDQKKARVFRRLR